jgi:hypothetical protein
VLEILIVRGRSDAVRWKWTRGYRVRTPSPPSGPARSTWLSQGAAPASTGTDALDRGLTRGQ